MRYHVQKDCVNIELRNALWSLIFIELSYNERNAFGELSQFQNNDIFNLFKEIWVKFFRWPIDEIPEAQACVSELKKKFQICEWYSVYDLLEIMIQNLPSYKKDEFIIKCNKVLEENNSAYRIVKEKVISITDDVEIIAIKEALETSDSLEKKHIQKAMNLISDRVKPDIENSIKESISAVECCLRERLKEPNLELSKLLNKLKEKKVLHSEFIESISKLYAFASDSSGIRHAFKDDKLEIRYEFSLYMLVNCSALVNFLSRLEV
jgi:uncharacterized protein YjhX (UPF0386 family)